MRGIKNENLFYRELNLRLKDPCEKN